MTDRDLIRAFIGAAFTGRATGFRRDDVVEALERLERADKARKRAVFLAEHLFQMIDPQTWRDSGADDGQGHYEGEYRAAEIRAELEGLRGENP